MQEKKDIAETLPEEPKTLWNVNFIVVLIFGFMTGTANQMVNPLLSKYAVGLGATLTLAGTIVGLQSGMAMFLRPFSGAASDLFNRKHVMMGSVMILAVAFTGYMVFHNVTAVILCRMLQGFGFAFLSVARTAYATEYMPSDRVGEGVALTTMGVVVSQAIGPNIGRWISESWGYNGCFAVSLGCCIIGVLIVASRPYQFQKGKFDWKKIRWSNLVAVEVIPYGVIAGLFSMMNQMANSFLYLLGDQRGIANVPLFFTVYALSTLVMRPLSGRLLDKLGLSRVLYPAFVFAAVGMGLIGSAQGLTVLLLAALCNSLSQGIAPQCIHGASIKRFGRERAGVIAATIHMMQDLVNSTAPMLGGALATGLGYGPMYFVFAGITLLGAPAYLLLQRSEKKSKV